MSIKSERNTKMKITSVRYFETNKGIGYQCQTNIKGVEVWNDGMGGDTYIDGNNLEYKLLSDYSESDLENLIDQYELKNYKSHLLTTY
jgi:hypothetical protein